MNLHFNKKKFGNQNSICFYYYENNFVEEYQYKWLANYFKRDFLGNSLVIFLKFYFPTSLLKILKERLRKTSTIQEK